MLPRAVRFPRAGWQVWAFLAAIAAGIVAIYSRTFSVPMMMDDAISIIFNSSIRGLQPYWRVLVPPDDAGVGGRPLLNLSYAVNYAFGGTGVFGYHLANLVIHVLAAWVLFCLTRRTLLRPPLRERFGPSADALSFSVAAIWAWHPVQTISVTYISERAESLMGLFYLLTVYFAGRCAETDETGGRRRWLLLSVLTCVAGITTKEVMVTAPLMCLLYDRTFISGSFRKAWERNRVLYLALVAALFPVTHRVASLHRQGLLYGVGFGGGVSWRTYGLMECRVVTKYVALAFWPNPLVFDYGKFLPGHLAEVWPFVLVLAALLAATFVAMRRWPAAGFAVCWFFLILAPTSSIVPLVGQPMAENRMYLPLAGLAALVVLGAFASFGRWSLPLIAVASTALGIGAFQRNRDFASNESIWSDTVRKVPDNARAHNNLGNCYEFISGRLNDAIAQYEEALRLYPGFTLAEGNLGILLAKTPGRLNDAITHFREALRQAPDSAEAHFNLGSALARIPGRMGDAAAEFERALRLAPNYAEAHMCLGDALASTPGRIDDAVAHYKEALRLNPDLTGARRALESALAKAAARVGDPGGIHVETGRQPSDSGPGISGTERKATP